MKQSESASTEDKSLFLIDFWATWCAPCVHVSTYLNEIQKQFPDKLYIVSLTNESPDVVKKFLNRHHTDLDVSIDYDKNNFTHYKVNALPYSILFNAHGDVLWKGNPADLKASKIEYFLHNNKETIPIDSFLKYVEYKTEEKKSLNIKDDYEIQEIENVKELSISKNNEYKIIEGTFPEILTYLFKIAPLQLIFPDEFQSKSYRLIIKLSSNINQTDLAEELLKEKRFTYTKEYVKGEKYNIYPFNPNLYWNENQIEWGEESASFLIGDQELTADNISLSDVLFQLSTIKRIPFIPIEPIEDQSLHDWEIHYKFDDLMKVSFLNYGIQIEKSYGSYPIYKVQKISNEINLISF